MSGHPLRRLFAILFAVAFFGASTLRVMPAVAMPAGMDMTMAARGGAPETAPVPCKGMTPACMSDVGCIFMMGVPVPIAPMVVDLAWAPVAWQWWPVEVVTGRARAPELRPPIRLV